MMLRLQGAPGDLLLPRERKIDPGIMVTMHKGGMKNPCMNSSQVVILNKCLEQGPIGLGGFGILDIRGENMLTSKVKWCVIITS